MTLGHRSPLDGFLLCGSVDLSPVLTLVFLHQPACSNLGRPKGQPQVLYEPPRKATPSPSGNNQFDQFSRQVFWFSILNDSDGISGTTGTSLQPEEWLTSRLHTPSPFQSTRKCQFPPNWSPTYTISSSFVSGESLNGIMKN